MIFLLISGAAREVEPDHCLLARIDFHGAMVVDLGLGFCKHQKIGERERERGKSDQISCGGEMKSHSGF